MREWYSIDQAKTVGPSILHRQQDKNCEDHNKQQKAPLFRPKVHEEQNCQTRLDTGDYQHSREHLRRVNILIGNDELQARESQQANIDRHVFTIPITFVLFCGCHKYSAFHLVAEIQEINERYHEHPDQIHEVPVKADNLQVIGFVAAALVA
jgi:hypothetical protein